MIDTGYVEHMARYNRWQNEMYAVADELSEADRRKQREAFFGSMLVPGLRRCWSSPAPGPGTTNTLARSGSQRPGEAELLDQAKTGIGPLTMSPVIGAKALLPRTRARFGNVQLAFDFATLIVSS